MLTSSEMSYQRDSQQKHCLPHSATNYKYDRTKENIYLDRIARLMSTERATLDSYAKIKLWEDGPNYQKVVKYVKNSQCHPNIKLTVVNIHRVWQRNRNDDNLFHMSNRKLLWHGTKRANIPHILDNGLKLPAHAGQMFGSGIYFADRISKSSNYSDLDVTFLLLCEVGLGNVYSCKRSHNTWKSAPVGFDSVKANGTYVPDWTDNERYYGAEIPFGKTAKCTKYSSHAVNYNEFIVYDPNRVIIRFLVEVSVQKVLMPTPLKLITPMSVVPTNKTTRKSTDSYAADRKNLKIKTISANQASAAIQTTAKALTRSNIIRSSGIKTTPANQASAAIQTTRRNEPTVVPASFPTSASTIRCAHWVQESYSISRDEYQQKTSRHPVYPSFSSTYNGSASSYSFTSSRASDNQSSSTRYGNQADGKRDTCTIL